MSHSTDLLFIHRTLNIMSAMKNIFPLSQKQVCLFPFSTNVNTCSLWESLQLKQLFTKKEAYKSGLELCFEKYYPIFPLICPLCITK